MKKTLAIAMILGSILVSQVSRADLLTKKEAHDECFQLALDGQTLEQFVEKGAGPNGAKIALDFTNRYIRCMHIVRNTGEVPPSLD